MRAWKIAVLSLSVISTAVAAPTAGAQAPGVMQRVGALNCIAERLDGRGARGETGLECELRLDGMTNPTRYSGTLVGSGLWLVDPGQVRLLWSVLAPTPDLSTDALSGSFGITTPHDFKLAEQKRNILFGGLADSVALELLAPAVDGISPSTRMTLRVSK